ncbi:MAG: hypothetical protein V8T87_07540 [Victivallales bacterium]
MLRHIILPLAAVFCGASCCLNAAENDTLEKMFSNISIFRKGDVQKKNDRANTKSVRYLGPQQLFFTVSVLNPAGRDITEGAASAELKQAFAQAVETQKQLRKGLKAEKTETLSLRCLAGKKLTGIYTVLTYTDNNLPHHICIFMTGYREIFSRWNTRLRFFEAGTAGQAVPRSPGTGKSEFLHRRKDQRAAEHQGHHCARSQGAGGKPAGSGQCGGAGYPANSRMTVLTYSS